METDLRKVRMIQNDGVSQLVQVEDEYGFFWIRRSRVPLGWHGVHRHIGTSGQHHARFTCPSEGARSKAPRERETGTGRKSRRIENRSGGVKELICQMKF